MSYSIYLVLLHPKPPRYLHFVEPIALILIMMIITAAAWDNLVIVWVWNLKTAVSLSIHVLVPHGVNRKLIESVGRVDLAYKCSNST